MESKYIEFFQLFPTGKTVFWGVRSKSSGVDLGYIKWYGPWRQYCFHPCQNTVFNVTCMMDISAKITQLMDERKRS